MGEEDSSVADTGIGPGGVGAVVQNPHPSHFSLPGAHVQGPTDLMVLRGLMCPSGRERFLDFTAHLLCPATGILGPLLHRALS